MAEMPPDLEAVETAPSDAPLPDSGDDAAPSERDAPTSPPDDGDDLDALLRQYEEETVQNADEQQRQQEQAALAEQQRQEQAAQAEQQRAQEREQRQQNLEEAVQYDLRVMAERARLTKALDSHDFSRAVTHAKDQLDAAGIPATETDIQRWLKSELADNAKLRADLDRRYADPASKRHAEGQLAKAFNRMVSEFRQRPDPELTANREAVAHAVRNHSKAPPEQPEVDAAAVAQMSDPEFEQWMRSQDTRRK